MISEGSTIERFTTLRCRFTASRESFGSHGKRLGRLVHFLLAERLRRPLRRGVLDAAEHDAGEAGTGDALGAIDAVQAPQLPDVLQAEDGGAAVLARHGE